MMTHAVRSAILGLATLIAMGACVSAVKLDAPKLANGSLRFTHLAPSAKAVYVVGSFNGWVKGATPMTRTGETGVWVADVALKPGEHTFMYLVDGTEWVVPPLAEDFVTDGFGQTNGVVIIR